MPISSLPLMVYGNMPLDGGFLRLHPEEKDDLLRENPSAVKFLRRIIGGNDFLDGLERWCLWIDDAELEDALQINGIKTRIEQVKQFRMSGGAVARTLVNRSHQFRDRREAKNYAIVVSYTGSERSDYVPSGFCFKDFIVMESAQVIYDPEPYIFGILSSTMYMTWIRAAGGNRRAGARYSGGFSHNTFPIPALTESLKEIVLSHVWNILTERERHSEKTISQLYDLQKMPADLLQAHRDLDTARGPLLSFKTICDTARTGRASVPIACRNEVKCWTHIE